MAKGGHRPGAGRPKGRQGSKTLDRLEAIKGNGITPLEYLLVVLRDEGQDQAVRIDAAKSAAPYLHPKLSSIELGGSDKPIKHEIRFPIYATS